MKVKTGHRKIVPWLAEFPAKIMKGMTFLATTGAKIHYCGGGWWLLLGYAYDGRDIKKIYQSL